MAFPAFTLPPHTPHCALTCGRDLSEQSDAFFRQGQPGCAGRAGEAGRQKGGMGARCEMRGMGEWRVREASGGGAGGAGVPGT